MIKGSVLEKLIRDKGYSLRGFAKKCGIPDSTLRSIIKNAGVARVDTIITICYHLQITVEELECLSKGIEYNGKSFEEVQAYIAQTRKSLSAQEKNELIKTILDEDNQIKKDA